MNESHGYDCDCLCVSFVSLISFNLFCYFYISCPPSVVRVQPQMPQSKPLYPTSSERWRFCVFIRLQGYNIQKCGICPAKIWSRMHQRLSERCNVFIQIIRSPRTHEVFLLTSRTSLVIHPNIIDQLRTIPAISTPAILNLQA